MPLLYSLSAISWRVLLWKVGVCKSFFMLISGGTWLLNST